MSALLRLEGIVSGYGRGDILRGVDFELEAGAIACIVGPNGAGKSTVLRTISGLLQPRAGVVLLDGEPIHGLSPARVLARGVVHVPQDRSLFPLMTVWDNMLMGAHALRDRAAVRRRAEELAERFALVGERRGERAGSLSGGQQKLVEIARALMLDPRLILMDEPSMGELNEGGRTVLLVEQNARAGLAISSFGAVMDQGCVALAGPAPGLLDDPRVGELYLGGAVAASA